MPSPSYVPVIATGRDVTFKSIATDQINLAGGRLEWTDAAIYREFVGTLRTDEYFAIHAGQADAQFTIWGGAVDALKLGSPGGGIAIKEGDNARMGVSTLVGGAVTVANTSVTATARIFLTTQNTGGTPGWVRVSARVAGTSFTITSSSGTDTSQVAWLIVEPS